MRGARSAAFVGFLATFVMTGSVALAVQLDASVDKRIVAPGETLTVTGTITDDEGAAGNFQYRIAVIAPGQRTGGERIIVCDSGRLETNGTSDVTFACEVPTLDGLKEIGVENADTRFVIPLKGGIAAFDPATNETAKEHGKALIVNTDPLKTKFEAALERIDAFIDKAQGLIEKCDSIIARAEEAGAENVVERCTNAQAKMREQMDKALHAQERINNALANVTDLGSFDFDDLRTSFVNFGGGARDFKADVSDLRGFVDRSRADLEKRVAKEIADRTRDRAKELRESVLQEKDRIEKRLVEVRDRVADRRSGVRSTATSESATDTAEPSNEEGA